MLTTSIARFQTWVIGEVSWFDSIVFYFISGFFIFVVTTIQRTANARLPLLLILFTNLVFERFICYFLITDHALIDTKILYEDIYSYIWLCRYFFIFVLIFYLIYHSCHYRDIILENNNFLQGINSQNNKILEVLNSINSNLKLREQSPRSDRFNFINENLHCNGFLKKSNLDLDESGSSTYSDRIKSRRTYQKNHLTVAETHNRYNLRSSKQNTPDLN